MEGLRQYVVSVVCASLVCCVLSGLTQKGFSRDLLRLLCGLFLTITVLKPIGNLEHIDLTKFSIPNGRDAAATGSAIAESAMADIIKAESEAYILNKAAALNAEISVNVTLSEEKLPVSVRICGEISPYARRQLEHILVSDMGITKENQLWTG